MALSWSGRRKALYTSVIGVIALLLLLFVYESFFNAAPTCFDGAQNGLEHGVDCGGSCALMCKQESRALVVLWARSFEAAPQTYTAAAYIQNDNVGAGAKAVHYTFQLFDASNVLVAERDGVGDIPPVHTVPIVEANIDTGSRAVAHTIFAFSDEPVWYKVSALPHLRLSGQLLSSGGSRLTATLNNDSLVPARASVAAVLFDQTNVAVAASKSAVSVDAGSTAPLVFTWGGGTEAAVRAEATILPAF